MHPDQTYLQNWIYLGPIKTLWKNSLAYLSRRRKKSFYRRHLVRDVVSRQLPQHVVCHSVDYGLSGVSGLPADALLGLHAQDGVQDPLGRVDLQSM